MLRTVLSAALVGGLAVTAAAQTVPTGFAVDNLVTSGLSDPNDFTFLPDGRVLICNNSGGVSLWTGGSSVSSVGTVSPVQTGSERGLLSIEADPNFGTNGYIYVWWSTTSDGFMHLDRLTCTGDLSNPASTNLSFSMASRRVIIGTSPDSAFNHNGGTCRFGPDGMLYVTIGDDANACSAQSLTSKSGVLLRINTNALPAGPSGTEPSWSSIDPGDNPLSANTGFQQLIIAYGLRNPFRMEIDAVTNNVYIGDVGQGAQEEYSEYVYQSGNLQLVNFGWPWREGTQTSSGCGGGTPPGLVGPIYSTTEGSWNSIMGGLRYRNQGGGFDLGAAYEGDCFFADYYGADLRRLSFNGATWSLASSVPGQPNGTDWGQNWLNITTMRQGPDGAIYTIQRGSADDFKRIRGIGPVNSVELVSGDSQRGPSDEPFAQPLRVQVLDTGGNPLPGGTVNFASAGATLSTTNPVIADANGYAETIATPTIAGSVSVTASTPGGVDNVAFDLFSRKLTVTWIGTSGLLVVNFGNESDAVSPIVPMILMMSYPGVQTLATPIGPICTDPNYALTVVLQDGTGIFGGVDYAGSGSNGSPGKSWVYFGVPTYLLNGFQMSFQALGLDPVEGWIRTGCEVRQF